MQPLRPRPRIAFGIASASLERPGARRIRPDSACGPGDQGDAGDGTSRGTDRAEQAEILDVLGVEGVGESSMHQ
jgi:hypothetical protein